MENYFRILKLKNPETREQIDLLNKLVKLKNNIEEVENEIIKEDENFKKNTEELKLTKEKITKLASKYPNIKFSVNCERGYVGDVNFFWSCYVNFFNVNYPIQSGIKYFKEVKTIEEVLTELSHKSRLENVIKNKTLCDLALVGENATTIKYDFIKKNYIEKVKLLNKETTEKIELYKSYIEKYQKEIEEYNKKISAIENNPVKKLLLGYKIKKLKNLISITEKNIKAFQTRIEEEQIKVVTDIESFVEKELKSLIEFSKFFYELQELYVNKEYCENQIHEYHGSNYEPLASKEAYKEEIEILFKNEKFKEFIKGLDKSQLDTKTLEVLNELETKFIELQKEFDKKQDEQLVDIISNI